MAITWVSPITKASIIFIFSSFLLPLILLTNRRNKLVIKNATPIILILFNLLSIVSLNNKPTIPTGILPRTIYQAYLKSVLVSSFLTLKYKKKFLISLIKSSL